MPARSPGAISLERSARDVRSSRHECQSRSGPAGRRAGPGLPITRTVATGDTAHRQNNPAPNSLVSGLELTGNRFVFYPGCQDIADLPLAEPVAELSNPGFAPASWPTSLRRADIRCC